MPRQPAKVEKVEPPKPSPSRAAQGTLSEDLALLFRAVVYEVPYIRFRDRIPADRFEQLVNLYLWDKYWEVGEANAAGEIEPAAADKIKADWLNCHPYRLEYLRSLPDYKEVGHEIESAFDRVAAAQERGYKDLSSSKLEQWRMFEAMKRLAYHATDEKVQQKALESMTDRVAGRLTAKEGMGGGVTINIGEVAAAAMVKALDEWKEVKELGPGEYSVVDAEEAP